MSTHPAIIALDKIQAEADALRSKPALIQAEIEALERSRQPLENAVNDGDESAVMELVKITAKTNAKRRQLDGLNANTDAFRWLNSERGANVLRDIVRACRAGLETLEKRTQADCAKLFANAFKGAPSALRAEMLYQTADDCAKLLESANSVRQALAAEGCIDFVPAAKVGQMPGAQHDFAAVLERLTLGFAVLPS